MINIPMQSQKDGTLLEDGIEYNSATGYQLIANVHNFYMKESGINSAVIDIFMNQIETECIWNDDFEGSLNPDIWDTSGIFSYEIVNGTLKLKGTFTNQKLLHKAVITENFDVQFDYLLENILESGETTNILQFVFYNPDSDYVLFLKHWTQEGTYNENYIETGGDGQVTESADTTAMSGVMGLQKIGTELKIKLNSEIIRTLPVSIDFSQLQIWHLAYGESAAYIDNFIFNSGCPENETGTWVLKYSLIASAEYSGLSGEFEPGSFFTAYKDTITNADLTYGSCPVSNRVYISGNQKWEVETWVNEFREYGLVGGYTGLHDRNNLLIPCEYIGSSSCSVNWIWRKNNQQGEILTHPLGSPADLAGTAAQFVFNEGATNCAGVPAREYTMQEIVKEVLYYELE